MFSPHLQKWFTKVLAHLIRDFLDSDISVAVLSKTKRVEQGVVFFCPFRLCVTVLQREERDMSSVTPALQPDTGSHAA